MVILESQTSPVTVRGMGGSLVSEILLLPSRGVALFAIDAYQSLGRSAIFAVGLVRRALCESCSF